MIFDDFFLHSLKEEQHYSFSKVFFFFLSAICCRMVSYIHTFIWMFVFRFAVAHAFVRHSQVRQYQFLRPLAAANDDEDHKDTIPSSSASASSASALSQAQLLQAQLEALRQEIQQDVQNLQQHKESLVQKKLDKVDQWIDSLLVAVRVDDDTQMLHSVERVAQALVDGRFSPEQVNAIFERITQEDPLTRVESPLVELLVDACNLVDCREEEENPNKRWRGRVEMKLRRRMFAMKWGIELEEDKEPNRYD